MEKQAFIQKLCYAKKRRGKSSQLEFASPFLSTMVLFQAKGSSRYKVFEYSIASAGHILMQLPHSSQRC